MMKKFLLILTMSILQQLLGSQISSAHPGSSIVVDKNGNIYFVYTGKGVIKISPDGKISNIHKATDGHWLCIDEEGVFSLSQPRYFERITPDGMRPNIIFAGGGSPIVIGSDGNFYYCGGPNGDLHPGAMTLVRETIKGKEILFSPTLEDALNRLNDGITGLAAAQDGFIYLACWNSVLKVAQDGKVSVIVHPVVINDCDEDPADHREENKGIPLLRGISIDSTGTIYAAAVSCHCVLKISTDGRNKTILKSKRPWSPTAVATHNGSIYVLEYTNANGPSNEGWIPRVRKIASDGTVTTIADFSSVKIE